MCNVLKERKLGAHVLEPHYEITGNERKSQPPHHECYFMDSSTNQAKHVIILQ
jgi:hypothetical protein